MSQPRRIKRDVHGWIALDKPLGMTSTQAVGLIKRLYQAKKVGHAGTLDPLATGLLPIALGEATKTVPFVMDGRKIYRFTIRFGIETETDDREGKTVATSDARPARAALAAILPRFTGTIAQVPPRFSAIKVDGERAYDLARDGAVVELSARDIEVHRLDLVEMPDADHAVLEAECGKGTYVRALARDIARALGSVGHVAALRRTLVSPFGEDDCVTAEALEEAAAEGLAALDARVMPVEAALGDLPSVRLDRSQSARIASGNPVILRGRDAPVAADNVAVLCEGRLIAIGEVARGELHPRRVFHLGG